MEIYRLTVNGREREISADHETPLLSILHHTFGLSGPRFGCGAGECGACRVLIDGHSTPSCDTPIWAVAGKQVVTIEGLGDEDRPHPLQKAFIAEQALQCGYCISGIMVTAAALLQRMPNPSEREIREALDRNLCRCGAHNRIVRAVQRASRELSA